ncbi:MAG: hypothetical protein RSC66_07695 [Comamonas sp.]
MRIQGGAARDNAARFPLAFLRRTMDGYSARAVRSLRRLSIITALAIDSRQGLSINTHADLKHGLAHKPLLVKWSFFSAFVSDGLQGGAGLAGCSGFECAHNLGDIAVEWGAGVLYV